MSKVEIEHGAVRVPLTSAIKRSLRISLLLAGFGLCALSGQASAYDTTNLPPVDAEPPDPEPPEEPLPEPPTPPPSEPGDPGDGGGGGGGEENGDVTCESLAATKPSMCPNPLPFPSGASYAEDRLPGASINGKSTLMMALAFTRGEIHHNGSTAATDANAAWLLAAALEQQTTNFTNGLKPLADSNKEFRVHLQLVCDAQTSASNAYRIPGVVTVPESYCFEMMKSFDQETNDQLTFIQWFADWSRRYAIDLGDYVPGALKDSAALDNSIGVKWKVTSEDAKCSSWWTQVQQLQCGL